MHKHKQHTEDASLTICNPLRVVYINFDGLLFCTRTSVLFSPISSCIFLTSSLNPSMESKKKLGARRSRCRFGNNSPLLALLCAHVRVRKPPPTQIFNVGARVGDGVRNTLSALPEARDLLGGRGVPTRFN